MIHDFTRKSHVGRFDFPNLKGHLRIDLKDARGNVVKSIEGDNMITDALKDIFASNYCGAMDYRKLLPLYSKMLGGVLCFGTNTLDVTSEGAAKDYFIPDNSTHPVIAHAGQTESSYGQADDVTRGRPLDTSMIVQDGAVTLAWEWGSAAGNGTIYSLGLTHADVGDAGTGSNSQAFQAMTPCINANFEALSFTHGGADINNMVMFVGSDGYGYRFWTSNTTVTITKIPLAYEETGLVAQPPFTDNSLNETHNVTVTTNFGANRPYYCYDKTNHKLWLFYNTSNSRTVYVEVIDLSTYTATNKSSDFSNLDAAVGPLYAYFPLQAPFDNGFVYLKKAHTTGQNWQNNGLLKIQLSSVANQTELDALVIPFGGLFETGASGKVIAGKQFVVNNNVLYPCTSGDWFTGSNPENITAFPFTEGRGGLAKLGGQFSYNNTNQFYYVTASKFYLASKYNLPSPITKQNSQSMVITYTLTEVS